MLRAGRKALVDRLRCLRDQREREYSTAPSCPGGDCRDSADQGVARDGDGV